MSDCTFIPANEERLPVHTQILGTPSDVFGTMCAERWMKNSEGRHVAEGRIHNGHI